MLRRLSFIFLFGCVTVAASAQSTGKPDPATPQLTGVKRVAASVSQWPAADSLKPGTQLIVTTKTDLAPAYGCRLVSISADSIVCEGRHKRNVSYDRTSVAMIEEAPHQRLHHLSRALLFASIAQMGAGGVCLLVAIYGTTAAAGGTVLILTGLLTALLGSGVGYADQMDKSIRGPSQATPIYIAPPAAAAAP